MPASRTTSSARSTGSTGATDYVDHHAFFCIRGDKNGLNHLSFEAADIDDVMVGHEHLEKKGYQHMWGIGRHLIGSQLFDYWADPWGRVHEHWADTDVLNASIPPNSARARRRHRRPLGAADPADLHGPRLALIRAGSAPHPNPLPSLHGRERERAAMSKYGIGQAVSRFEDPRLLRGNGRYQDDVNLPGQAHAVFLRSPHAHARINGIDAAAAAAMPASCRLLPQPAVTNAILDALGPRSVHTLDMPATSKKIGAHWRRGKTQPPPDPPHRQVAAERAAGRGKSASRRTKAEDAATAHFMVTGRRSCIESAPLA